MGSLMLIEGLFAAEYLLADVFLLRIELTFKEHFIFIEMVIIIKGIKTP